MDCVGVVMIGDQDILIALAWCDWEHSCLVRNKLSARSTVLKKTRLVSSDWMDCGKWSCSGSSSEWITFACVDLIPFRGCWRCPSMVDCFFKSVCAPSPLIGLDKKWRIFLWLLFPIHIEWGFSGMRGDSPPMCFWLALLGAPCKIFIRSRGLRH